MRPQLAPVLAGLLAGALLACTPASAPGVPASTDSSRRATPDPRNAPRDDQPKTLPPVLAAGLAIEPVADNLQLPANLTFTPDGRLWFTEVSLGRVRVIERGALLPEPLAEVDKPNRPMDGLLGLALDPDFTRNHNFYVYYSQYREDKGSKPWRNRVARLTESGGKGVDPRVILDDLPIARSEFDHNGGRLSFGADGKLYVTVGDVGQQDSAQDPKKLSGKILRINPDGSIPADNPKPGSPIFALGLRNPWGLGFHPRTGVPYVTDNGRTARDEVDLIRPGGNYGSPDAQGIAHDPRFIDPIYQADDDVVGITGLGFYTGNLFPQFRDDLLFCTYGTSRLMRLKLAGPNLDQVAEVQQLANQCALDVVSGPDGAIYVSSIDRIQRLVPVR